MSQAEFSCPLLSKKEYDQVAIPFDRIEDSQNGVQAVMDEFGFCIVTDVLSLERAQELEQTMTRELSSLVDRTKMKENPHPSVQQAWAQAQEEGVGAWPDNTLKKMGQKNRFQLRGLPHTQFAWDCRLDPKVRRVYEVLHQTHDLVSSCDNSFVSNRLSPAQTSNKSWPHADQNDHDPTVAAWDVYQGLLYVWGSDNTEHASTTVVWPKSHKKGGEGLYTRMYMNDPKVARRGARGQHFTPLPHSFHNAWEQQARRVPVPVGGLLLWSSRTTHQGWSGGPRLAQPVCWEPAARRTEETRYRKWALAALGLPSTHWASLGQPHHLVKQQESAVAVHAQHSRLPDRVVFALKAQSIRSVALKDGVSSRRLWNALGSSDLNEPLSAEAKALLNECIKEEFKLIL